MRWKLALFAPLVALLLVFGAAPALYAAGGCTNSWINASGGSWFTSSNWSTGSVPGSGDDVCVTLNGTYTVLVNGTTVTVDSLTLGGTSGTQTLQIGSTCSLHEVFTSTGAAGTNIGTLGVLQLTNADGCGNNATLVGPVSNAGILRTDFPSGGTRFLQGNLSNSGTLLVNGPTQFNSSGTTLTNTGTVSVADGQALSVLSGANFANNGGTIGATTAAGTGAVSQSSGTFTQNAGTTTGTQPVVIDDATLSYTSTGASLLALRGTSNLSGTSGSSQTLNIQSTCGENASVTAGSGFTNGGTLNLTNGDGCGNSVTLIGTVTNGGTLQTLFPAGGSRSLQGNLTNSGTLTINGLTHFDTNGAALTNTGTVSVANGQELSVDSGATFTNNGGTIGGTSSSGTGLIFDVKGAFTEGSGATQGTLPVIVDDGALTYTGTGASLIAIEGASSLSGNMASGQSLDLLSTCSEHAVVTAGGSFTNAGTITLTNGDGCGNNETLSVSSGTLTNTGTIQTLQANGGVRTIQGNLTNSSGGSLLIDFNTNYNGSGTTLTNNGTLSVADTMTLTVSNTASTTNSGGVLGATSSTGSGLLFESGGTFTQDKGATTGSQPVVVDDATLNYTNNGSSTIALRGNSTLEGTTAAGQTLNVQSTCAEHAVIAAAAGFTNAGTITLTNGDGCGNNETLAVSSGTLTNSGTIATQVGVGGSRTLQGNVSNSGGTLTINANTTFSGANTLTNAGKINIANGISLAAPNAPTIANNLGGSINASSKTGTGVLVQTGGTFTENKGTTTGSKPVILDDGTLSYLSNGSSFIALRGSSTLTGNISAGQTLQTESTSAEHATITANAAFANSGILIMTNGDGAGNNVTLQGSFGTLTNNGTLESLEPAGGSRTISGNVSNSKTVQLGAGTTLQITGTYTETATGAGITETINSNSSFGKMNVSGAATLKGSLTISRLPKFVPTSGTTFSFFNFASLAGTWASQKKGNINASGLYFLPAYTGAPSNVTLTVTQATATFSTTNPAPGEPVIIAGTNWAHGTTGPFNSDQLTITFTDSAKVKTVYPTVTTDSAGAFSVNETIPSTAAAGKGTISIVSKLTGATFNQSVTVS